MVECTAQFLLKNLLKRKITLLSNFSKQSQDTVLAVQLLPSSVVSVVVSIQRLLMSAPILLARMFRVSLKTPQTTQESLPIMLEITLVILRVWVQISLDPSPNLLVLPSLLVQHVMTSFSTLMVSISPF